MYDVVLALRVLDVLPEIEVRIDSAAQEQAAERVLRVGEGRKERRGIERDSAAEVVQAAEALARRVAVIEMRFVIQMRRENRGRTGRQRVGIRNRARWVAHGEQAGDRVRRRVIVSTEERHVSADQLIHAKAGRVECRSVRVASNKL